jgi:hypothetical protein
MQAGQNSDTRVGFSRTTTRQVCACSFDFASNAASHAEHAFGLCSKLEIFWASFSLPLFFFLSRRRCALFIITPFFEKMALTQTLGVRGFGTFP